MKTARCAFLTLVLVLEGPIGIAQTGMDIAHRSGPSVSWGIGNYAINDRYISSQRYDGTIFFAQFNWSDVVGSRIYDISLSNYHSRSIRNYTVPASVSEPRFSIGIRYAVTGFELFGMPSVAFLGPSIEMLIHHRSDDIAATGNGAYPVTTVAFLGSVRLNASVDISPTPDILACVGLRVNAFSLAGRNNSSSSLGTNGFSLMMIPDAIRIDMGGTLSYNLIAGIVVELGYRFDLTRIALPFELLEASSSGIVTVAYSF